MKLFNKIFFKQDNDELSEEEKVQLDSILHKEGEIEMREDGIENRDSEISEDDSVTDGLEFGDSETNKDRSIDIKADLGPFIDILNLEQLNELKALIEKKEDFLLEKYGLKDEPIRKGKKKEKKVIVEENVEKHVTSEDLNEETYEEEVTNDVSKNLEFVDSNKEESSKKKKTVEIESLNDRVFGKLVKIFGEENVFSEYGYNESYDILNGRKVFQIGIRMEKGFDKEISDKDQNVWFVSHIKKFDELKVFKMLKSTEVQKDLLWDLREPVLIVYKSTNALKGKEKFIFD